jgi:AAA15 family ATPase/GTPase
MEVLMEHAITKIKVTDHFIKDVDWENIPPLAVITGVNGSGKTQLLNAINAACEKSGCFFNYDSDLDLQQDEFRYVRWSDYPQGIGGASYPSSEAEYESFIQRIRNSRQKDHDTKSIRWINSALSINLLQEDKSTIDREDVREAYFEAWVYQAETTKNEHLAKLFVQYWRKFETTVISERNPQTGVTPGDEEIVEMIGERPWNIINKLFAQYGFKYKINYPDNALKAYAVEFINIDTEERVPFAGLSSGERMIVSLVLWSYNEKLGSLRKLLLLDEPDAHLHPEMAKMFKEIVSDVLVKKHGIQVILTTHSPTTVCWFEDENIFVMSSEGGIRSSTKSEAIELLTSGLLHINRSLKLVLVEDGDDQKFHQAMYDHMAYSGYIEKVPSVSFKSVVTEGVNEGGKSVVEATCRQWSNFCSNTSVEHIIHGLVDRDSDDNRDFPPNLRHLSRYCHENYYSDPLVVFALAIEEEVANETIRNIAQNHCYQMGCSLKFKDNKIDDPQAIADEMIQALVNETGCDFTQELADDKVRVEYVNEISVDIPKVLLNKSGKDIALKYFKAAFPDFSSRLNASKLTKTLKATNLIPVDLIDVYESYTSV